MCVKNAIQLSLDGDTFSALKKDFDAMLNRTVTNMESKSSEEATITMKLVISLEKERVNNFDEEPKQITRPTFKHDISSVMQVKDKVSGTLKEDYELVFDEDEGKYVMRRISNGQMSIFETPDEEDADEPIYAPALMSPVETVEEDADEDVIETTADDITGETVENEQSVRTGAFVWLKQFIGSTMHITESMGNYAVRTDKNAIVLTSSTDPSNVFYCDASKLAPHVGHSILCVGYGDEDIVNISIECEDCNETLYEIDAPFEVNPDDVNEPGYDYDYEEPGEA